MKGMRVPLTVVLLFVSLVLFAFGTINLVSGPVWLVFRRAEGLATVKTIADVAALLTAVTMFAAALTIAIPTALLPAPRNLKWLFVLPAYLIIATLAMAVANILGLATLGSILNSQSAVKLSLAQAGLGVSAVLGTLAVAIAAARANLGPRVLKAAFALTGVAFVPAVVLTLAMLASGNIIAAQSSQMLAGNAADQEGLGSRVRAFETGGGITAVFALVALGGILLGARAWRQSGETAVTTPGKPRDDYRREATRALVSAVLITVVIFVAMQLVPISRENPPVQGNVAWDSPQTQALVGRACMNCHSNETQWPWYSYFAPGSWITAVHVTSARQQFNLSELTKLSSSRKIRLARDMADQIQSGVMPPSDFLLMHPEARLSPAEKEQLIRGLQNSLK